MNIRLATQKDVPQLSELIKAPVRGIGIRRYNARQIESSLTYLFGIDSRVINDQTYFVVETDDQIVGCGGWMRHFAIR